MEKAREVCAGFIAYTYDEVNTRDRKKVRDCVYGACVSVSVLSQLSPHYRKWVHNIKTEYYARNLILIYLICCRIRTRDGSRTLARLTLSRRGPTLPLLLSTNQHIHSR
jgi:hypothetical protein